MTDKKDSSPKKTLVNEIVALLTPALATLKTSIGEKKFDKRVKKAAKVLAQGIKPAVKKSAPAAKPATKKTIPKKAKKATATKIPVAKKAIAIKTK